MVAVKSARCSPPDEPYPWLGRVTKLYAKSVKILWLSGTYTSPWILNPEFKSCSADSVKKTLIIARLNLDLSRPMPEYIVKRLRQLYGEESLSDPESDVYSFK